LKTIISFFILALGVAQPSIAAIKESKSNRYADNAQFSAGSRIAMLVTKKPYTAQGYSDNAPTGDLIKVDPWGQGEYITKGSVTVLKALLSELRVMGYKVRLVDKPSLISPGEYVIAPNIAIRMAEMKGRVAKWDNTRAIVKEKGRGAGELTWTGSTQAVSILINAYNPEGKWLFKSYGGIAIPSYVDLRSGKDLIKENIYDKEKLLVDGIKQVLLPLKSISVDQPVDYKHVKFMSAMKNPFRFKAHKCKYKEYLEQPNHKAFFVHSSHSNDRYFFGWAVAAGSIKSALAEAKSNCETEGDSCELFDLDGELIANVSNLNLDIQCNYEK